MKQDIKKGVILIGVVFLLSILSLGFIFHHNLSRTKSIMVTGVIKFVGSDYIIIEDFNGKEYEIDVEEKYEVGDTASVLLQCVNEHDNLITGKALEIQILELPEKLEDSFADDSNVTNYDTNDDIDLSQNQKEIVSDDAVLEYVELEEKKLFQDIEVGNLSKNVKSGFIALVDFLFYDGQIKGKTFSELKDSTKLKILQLFFVIDSKIEEVFPQYKESISNNGNKIYTNLKEKVIDMYLTTSVKVCKENVEMCDAAKNGLRELKDSFSLTWSFIKNISGVGFTKLKNWYEVWRDVS